MPVSPFVPRRKLTDSDRAAIRRYFKVNPRIKSEMQLIAGIYGVSWFTVQKALNVA
jgi:hypothetical protein